MAQPRRLQREVLLRKVGVDREFTPDRFVYAEEPLITPKAKAKPEVTL